MEIQTLNSAIIRRIEIGIPLDVVAAIRALLHNAYDANAVIIRVTISKNGIDSIEVTDNGHGISRDNCKRIAKPYSTSKIRTREDLQKLGGDFLGFRGLDLARLAEQCASMKITTKTDECSLPSMVRLKPYSPDIGTGNHNRGTTVRVENLFSTCPIRGKDAWQSKTLVKKIIDMLTASALARPYVSLRLCQAEKVVWVHTPLAHGRLSSPALNAVCLVFGPRVSSQCELIHRNAEGYTFDAACNIANGRDDKPFITVDGRPISRAKQVAKTLIKCYQRVKNGNLCNKSSFWYLNIRCPEASYDVNVDPEKDDLVFANAARVENLWKSALQGYMMKVQDSSVEVETLRHLKSQQSVAEGVTESPRASCEMSSAATPHTGQASRKSSLVDATAQIRSATSGTHLAVADLEDLRYRQDPKGHEDWTERRSSGQSSDPNSSGSGPEISSTAQAFHHQAPRRSTRKRTISSNGWNDRPLKRARTSPHKRARRKKVRFRVKLVNPRVSKDPREQSARLFRPDPQVEASWVVVSATEDVHSEVTTLNKLQARLREETDENILERWEHACRSAEISTNVKLDLTPTMRRFRGKSRFSPQSDARFDFKAGDCCQVQSDPSQPGSLQPEFGPQPRRASTPRSITITGIQLHSVNEMPQENSFGAISRENDAEAFQTSSQAIQVLGQDVVNKIAAGEVIVSPVDALKELIENAIDAGSTSVDIEVRKRDLTCFKIADNGQGIRVRMCRSLSMSSN